MVERLDEGPAAPVWKGGEFLCGIAGIVSTEIDANRRADLVARMLSALRHRGPDDRGVITAGEATLGTARLSIVDRLGGHQPLGMELGGETGWIAYNGEVYNHAAAPPRASKGRVSASAPAATPRPSSPPTWSEARVRSTISTGMFAYAVWSARRGELLLVRDPLGIKPLYYADLGATLLFASEPRALFCYEGLTRQPDPLALLEYFLHGGAFAAGYTTADRSFYAGVKALPTAHMMTWVPGHGARARRYWSPVDELGPAGLDRDEALGAVTEAVERSVGATLMGEVPVGTALSGGLDSSLITSIATRLTGSIVSSCITFRDDRSDDDARHATLVSHWLKRAATRLSPPGIRPPPREFVSRSARSDGSGLRRASLGVTTARDVRELPGIGRRGSDGRADGRGG